MPEPAEPVHVILDVAMKGHDTGIPALQGFEQYLYNAA